MNQHIPPVSDVDLRQLRIFRAVVEQNGFTRAQAILGISRSTISAQMAALETRLGLTLCQRGRSGFSLTEQGHRVYAEAIKCFAALDHFRAELGVMRGRLVGELRLGVVDAVIENPQCRLYEALAAFSAEVPEVHVALSTVAPNQIEQALINRQMDVALVPNLPMNAAVQLQNLFQEEQCLYCGRLHPLFDPAQGPLTLEKIADQAYARRSYSVSTAYNSLFAKAPAATVNSMESMAHLVLSGRYLGFLPVHYAKAWVDKGEMRAVRPDLIGFRIGVCIGHFPLTSVSLATRIFRDHVVRVHRFKARLPKS
ncbi:LysR family transcriptional regulator [Allorhizobium sp. BGMRC 0089]|uniref:LysR family transcriptional regulator n=1 Tax=Allorhizobium sonneratiae TaxID=2934936 RepID=UPI002033A607|nr:LysR family transcriptional regulator [Allorhizobium sonneratiae]MCM2293176.1 LysR family transcriptional regulator [Allorhizobium sonneratiae]